MRITLGAALLVLLLAPMTQERAPWELADSEVFWHASTERTSSFEHVHGVSSVRNRSYSARVHRDRTELFDRGQGAPYTLYAASVRRGASLLTTEEPAHASTTRSVQRRLSDDIIEHVEPLDEGIALAWLVEREPAGSGTLSVDVALAGPRARFSVGGVTVVDHMGRRWSLPRSVTDDRLHIAIPEHILANASYPFAIDPIISPELDVTDAMPRNGPGLIREVMVAATSTGFLVVWQEGRGDIAAVRVDLDGAILDATPIDVSSAPRAQSAPRVACTDEICLVVWTDDRNNSGADLAERDDQNPRMDIFGGRVRMGDGVVLDGPEGFAIGTEIGDDGTPAVASNGEGFLVGWLHGDYNESALRLARVDAAGVVVPTMTGAVPRTLDVGIASDGSDYVVVGMEYDNSGTVLETRKVRAVDGTVLAPIALSGLAQQTLLGITQVQDQTHVLFNAQGARLQRLSSTGELLDGNSGRDFTTILPEAGLPTVASDGEALVVGFLAGRTPSLARVLPGASQVQALASLDADVEYTSMRGIACNATRCALAGAFYGAQNDVLPIHVVTMPQMQPARADADLVARHLPEEGPPSVAACPDGWLVAWSDPRNGSDVLATRVRASDLATIDRPPLVIATGLAAQDAPEVTSNGSDMLVAWVERDGHVRARRVQCADGMVLDGPMGTELATEAPSALGAASSATQHLVAWIDRTDRSVRAARVRASDGVVLDPAPGILVSSTTSGEGPPAVASNGVGFLVAWHDGALTAAFPVRAALVEADGVVQDAPGAFPASASAVYPGVTASSDGSDYAVAWTQGNGTVDANVVAVRVRASDGTIVDAPQPLVVNAAPGRDETPWMVPVPLGYLVTWQHHETFAVATRFLTGSGEVQDLGVDQPGFAFSVDGLRPRVSMRTPLDGLVVYTRPQRGTRTVAARRITLKPPPQINPLPAQRLAESETLSFTVATAPMGPLTCAVDGLPPAAVVDQDTCVLTWVPDFRAAGMYMVTLIGTVDGITLRHRTTVTVDDANGPPEFPPFASQLLRSGTRFELTVVASDPDNDPVTLGAMSLPPGAMFDASSGRFGWTPTTADLGPHVVTFTAADASHSVEATMLLEVRLPNRAPRADPQALEVPEDNPLSIAFTGSDDDGDGLAFVVDTQPIHGRLEPDQDAWRYVPDENFNGEDTFTFHASDGMLSSEPATVRVTVTPVNDAPVASPALVMLDEDVPTDLLLQAGDVDGDALTFSIVTPEHGTLEGEAPAVRFVPEQDFSGRTSFIFSVTDGEASAMGMITLEVRPVDDAPRALDLRVSVQPDSSVGFRLQAIDVDSGGITYTVTSQPAQGTLTGVAPNLVYRANADASGEDGFTFVASAGGLTSLPAQVVVTVTPATQDEPQEGCACSTSGSSSSWAAWAVMLGVLVARRRPRLLVAWLLVLSACAPGAGGTSSENAGSGASSSSGASLASTASSSSTSAMDADSSSTSPVSSSSASMQASSSTSLASSTSMSTPSGPPLKPATLATGDRFSCVQRVGEPVRCWGANRSRTCEAPQTEFDAIFARDTQVCGLRADGTAECWGALAPNALPGAYTRIAPGSRHVCALSTGGSITCAGSDTEYQLNAPTSGTFIALSSSNTTSCAVEDDGSLVCWGNGNSERVTPLQGTFVDVELATYGGCAMSADNSVTCWGTTIQPQGRYQKLSFDGGGLCALRMDSTIVCFESGSEVQPVQGTFKSLAVGAIHACAVRDDDALVCWGSQEAGVLVSPFHTYTALSGDGERTCGLLPDGALECWEPGYNPDVGVPAGQYTKMSAGSSMVCGITADRVLECGERTNPTGAQAEEAFFGVEPPTPIIDAYGRCVVSPSRGIGCVGEPSTSGFSFRPGAFKRVFTGNAGTCGIQSDDSLSCWHFISPGIGDAVPFGSFKDVSIGLGHACALSTEGQITCWGPMAFDPSLLEPPAGTFASLATVGTSCALDAAGTMTCWGDQPVEMPSAELAYRSLTPRCGLTVDGEARCAGGAFR